jgi:hypothetical protein
MESAAAEAAAKEEEANANDKIVGARMTSCYALIGPPIP